MWYPQKGSIAIGSRRTLPTAPAAAAVVSEPTVAPTKTPWTQLKVWKTRGMVVARRPPKTMALMGTPSGFSQAGSRHGHWAAGAVKRAFGWAEGRPQSGVQLWPCQSVRWPGATLVIPSHQTSPSSVKATLVKIVFARIESMAFGLES